jgi:AcrR family transcriptional regulator
MSRSSDQYHHGDLRKALLREAYEVLRRDGAEAVSLRAVAGAVGVSPSAAYHHFPDKDALLVAAGDLAAELFDRRMVDAAASVRGDSDRAALKRFIALGRAYIDFAQEEPHLFRHMFGELCAAKSPVTTGGSPAFDALMAALDTLMERGLLRPSARQGLELVAWSCVHGFAVLAAAGLLPAASRDDLLDALCRIVIG